MDLASVLGSALGWLVVIVAILIGGSPMLFYDLISILLVVGGGTFATMIKFGIDNFANALNAAKNVFINKSPSINDLIDKIEELAVIARKEGILALERVTFDDVFLQKGVNYLVDGADSEQLQSLLYTDIANTSSRHEVNAKIFSALGEAYPAFGMIGTLVGLVQMLAAMDDPASIGPAMATALLTTLYGSLLANLIVLPFSDKLSLRNGQEEARKNLIIEGLLGIQKGENPKILREFLETYLPPRLRKKEE